MADPQHTPHMSALDNFTVVLYRIGLLIMAISSAIFVVEQLMHYPLLEQFYLPTFAIGTALSSGNVHLYDVRFRWFIPFVAWLGFMLLAITYGYKPETGKLHYILETGSLGFFYASAGMFAVKEQFCFKIPGLQTVPFLLAISIGCRFFHLNMFESIILIPASVLLIILSIVKWKMPLHFDVGDKTKYTL